MREVGGGERGVEMIIKSSKKYKNLNGKTLTKF